MLNFKKGMSLPNVGRLWMIGDVHRSAGVRLPPNTLVREERSSLHLFSSLARRLCGQAMLTTPDKFGRIATLNATNLIIIDNIEALPRILFWLINN